MERKKFLKQNSQNKWQKRGLEDNYFKLPFSQNILPKILRIFAKNVECAHLPFVDNPKEELEKLEEEKQEGVESFGMYQNLARAFQTRETRLEGTAEPEEEAEKG